MILNLSCWVGELILQVCLKWEERARIHGRQTELQLLSRRLLSSKAASGMASPWLWEAQRLRALSALPKVLGSILSTHIGSSQPTVWLQFQGDPMFFLDLCRHGMHMVQMYKRQNTHTHKEHKFFLKEGDRIDGSVGEGTWHQAWQCRFNLWDPHCRRGKRIPTNYPLASTRVWRQNTQAHTQRARPSPHTYTQSMPKPTQSKAKKGIERGLILLSQRIQNKINKQNLNSMNTFPGRCRG